MARYVTGRELGRRICEALGIDPASVAGVTVECDAGDVARVIVEHYVTDEQAEAILDDLRLYRLVEEDAQ